MCVKLNDQSEIATRTIVAYKVVSIDPDGIPESEYSPGSREKIPGYETVERGVRLRYQLGSMVVSPGGPGIMAYESLEEAKSACKTHYEDLYRVIQVLIPKGSEYRKGTNIVPDVGTWEDVAQIFACQQVEVIGVL